MSNHADAGAEHSMKRLSTNGETETDVGFTRQDNGVMDALGNFRTGSERLDSRRQAIRGWRGGMSF